jgi:predicted DNA-binding transcriptional regulator YafY
MPANKDAVSRYRIIDRELRRWRLLSSQQLAERCSSQLGREVSKRTIQKDIVDMKEDMALCFNAPIQYDKQKRRYYYERGVSPLQFLGIQLNEEETYAVLFYIKSASHFGQYPIFKEMTKAIEKILDATNISKAVRKAFLNETVLETENLLPSQGIDFIKPLVQAVTQRRVVSFVYKRFVEDITKKRSLKPLVVKEYKGMWYVVGMLETRDHPVTFAVDRMRDLIITNEVFAAINFSSEEHFRHSYGITADYSVQPQDVVLFFTKEQGNYIKVNPIHLSQKILQDDDTGLKVQLRVKLSVELDQKILGYGDGVTVLAPKELIEIIRKKLDNALKKY